MQLNMYRYISVGFYCVCYYVHCVSGTLDTSYNIAHFRKSIIFVKKSAQDS